MPPPLHPPRPRGPRSSSPFRTPEPCVPDAPSQPPTPLPRPLRLRLKKRAVSHLSAPTQQFLASVDAADVPMPSIEEPPVVDMDDGADQPTRGRTLSSPKTLTPRAVPSLSPKRFPDWSLGASLSSLEPALHRSLHPDERIPVQPILPDDA